ncbi:hypothetical protein J4223_01795 [Candidatus Woesearchaeota archaeon]|nr:hypothetical protein [Candidatus Woesearchaeota archaeon]
MGIIKTTIKLILSIVFDVTDFFIGRIPVFGTIFDIFGGILAIFLWGSSGAIQFWEVIDITDQFDGFIPTVTIIGIASLIFNW